MAGGLNSAEAEVYSPNGGCSVSLPSLPEENANPHLAFINTEIFYCPLQGSTQCYMYDQMLNDWSTYTSMTNPHNKSTSIIFRTFIV